MSLVIDDRTCFQGFKLKGAGELILLVSMQLISPTNMSKENLFRQANMDPIKKYIQQTEAADISQ